MLAGQHAMADITLFLSSPLQAREYTWELHRHTAGMGLQRDVSDLVGALFSLVGATMTER